ncbi:glycerophosphodiester phosphodiesterase family protein [Sedimentitalea arenosa]|uniref:Glycerophosphoryl diester phosphodiesterase membrane domain-containing protein n=1 Tax=Sedimentitalea arenosa TaxID=2798803 RepID=A0A8J7IIA5_9RHOB|nr:glycerophosphodiester phosphodiesterase family protein [Arenibacterium arenosum]MBJ6371267.1 glycerophosphoryl diester phosphodiesterase membrane domain-containing protein [Arenibacterium arenosum]
MTAVSAVLGAFTDAWSRRRVIVGVYLALRLVSYSVLAPLLAALIGFSVSLSAQSALTDQDIAGFILSPAGFVAAVLVLSLLLVVEVLGFALMTAIWRSGAQERFETVRTAVFAVAHRGWPLLQFAVLFVLRVLVLAAPFVLAGLLVAWMLLSDYDINYYLTQKPTEALVAAALIGLLVLLLAALLLVQLTGWALSLHLVLFAKTAPTAAFRESAALMAGKKFRLQRKILVWLLLRFLMLNAVALLAGLILNLIPFDLESGLRGVLTVTLAVAALWMLARLVISALALAALARVIDGLYAPDAALEVPPAPRAKGVKARLLGAIGVLAVVVGVGFWAGARIIDGISTKDNVEIIAHRGAAGIRPENTLASVEQALEDGADWVEIDVQETADGQIVVVHDSDFMKLAGVDLKVWNATMEDLAEIDIGGWFDPVYADQRTPLLREVLERARDRAKVLIELKYYGHNENLEHRVIEIVEDLGMQDQVATMSLKYPLVQKMLELRPDWPSGVLAATAVGDLSGLDGDFVAVSAGRASPWLARSLENRGKALFVWTVNDPLEMSKMISMGADGLITDEPALARKVVAARADLSTPERLVLWLTEELGIALNDKAYRDGSP